MSRPIVVNRPGVPPARLATRFVAALALLIAGCGEEAPTTTASLERVLPDKAMRGQVVSIWGKELGVTGSLTLASRPVAAVGTWATTRIEFTVPGDAPSGATMLAVRPDGGGSLEIPFTVLDPPPEISQIEPERAKVGDWVVLTGKMLGTKKPDSKLNFHGSDVTEIKSWTETRIEFRIPAPGTMPGITVQVGPRVSNPFTMTLIRPVASDAEPNEVLPGEELTLSGTDFTDSPGTVQFEGREVGGQEILEWTDQKIRLKVPKLKEGLTKIRVKNANGLSLPTEVLVLLGDKSGTLARTVSDSKYARVLLDKRNLPHVVFFEQTMQSPVHWFWLGKPPGWARRHVRIPRDARQKFVPAVGWFPSIAFDEREDLHITCYDLFSESFLYGRFDREKKDWIFTRPDATGKGVGMFTSLAVKPGGEVLIAYMSWNDGMLKLARGTGDKFTILDVDGSSTHKVGMTPSLRLDKRGEPCIAYLDFEAKDLKYAFRDPAQKTFTLETVDSPGHVGEFPSMRLSREGEPRVVYFQRSTQASEKDGLKLAYRSKDGWKTQVVEAGPGVGYSPAMELDAQGRVHAVYLSREDSALHYAVGVPGKDFKIGVHKIDRLWVPEEPINLDMALGSDGFARVAFWTDPPKTLEFRKLEPPK